MQTKTPSPDAVSLVIPCSSITTEGNKTGTWRYFRPLYAEKTAPCSAACPLGEDIARIEMLAARGLLQQARQTLLAENPFPAVCGRVCFHPCERACNRKNLDAPVAVHLLERFLGDLAADGPQDFKPRANAKKVAVVGAGPAGLAAAFFLKRLGHACDVFEARAEPGGLLRWAIPVYRLPQAVLTREIRNIEKLGIKIHCQTDVNPVFLKKIQSRYDAVFIACGHRRPIGLKIAGDQMARDGLGVLDEIRSGQKPVFQGPAAVIGGGNTAVDVARSLLRRGASPLLIYRRRRQDMPAFPPEVQAALKEGVQLKEMAAPIRIEEKQDTPPGGHSEYLLILQRMKISAMPIKGRARVVPDGDKTETLRVNSVFTAIGAEAEALWQSAPAAAPEQLPLSHCKLIGRDPLLVVGGDLTNRVRSVSDAIASGKQAAMAMDLYFEAGWKAIEPGLAACRVGTGPAQSMEVYLARARSKTTPHIVAYDEINTDYFPTAPRANPPVAKRAESIPSFSEIERTLSREAAVKEARRCFNCGTCNACDNCRIFCPEMAVVVNDDKRRVNLDYCKGCGICVTECPRSAMVMEEETQ